MTWQPIETAPKDGRPIIGWDGHAYIWDVSWDRYRLTRDRWEEGWLTLHGNNTDYYCKHNLTHWMKLPPPPIEEERA